MKCPLKLPLKADVQSNFLFDADDMAAGVIGGEARKAYAIRAINNHDRLLEALRRTCDAVMAVNPHELMAACDEDYALLAQMGEEG